MDFWMKRWKCLDWVCWVVLWSVDWFCPFYPDNRLVTLKRRRETYVNSQSSLSLSRSCNTQTKHTHTIQTDHSKKDSTHGFWSFGDSRGVRIFCSEFTRCFHVSLINTYEFTYEFIRSLSKRLRNETLGENTHTHIHTHTRAQVQYGGSEGALGQSREACQIEETWGRLQGSWER